MRFKSLFLVLVVGLSCANATQQQTVASDAKASVPTTTTPPVTPVTVQSGAANSISAADRELAVLKAEVAAAQAFRSDTLSTIYWSLSTVGGIVLLLVGYSWWSNFKVYERDKQLLMDELAARNTAQMAALDKAVTAALSEERGRTDKLAADERKNFHEQIGVLQEAIGELADVQRSDTEELSAGRNRLEKELLRRISETDWTVATNARRAAQGAGRHSVALSSAIAEFERAVDIGYAWRERDAMEGMLESLGKGGQLTQHEMEVTKQTLDRLGNNHLDLKASLMSAISKPGALFVENK